MIAKWNFNFLGRTYNLLFRSVKEKKVLHYGVGNRCKNGQYVLFLDYDDTPLEWVEEELLLLQKRFEFLLGDAYLFKTKNGIHVIFLEKHHLGRIIQMMDMTSCDKNYKTVPLLYARKVWVLRQSEKKGEDIRYLGKLSSPSTWDRSKAHALYLEQFCKVPHTDLVLNGALDDQDTVTMGYYHITERNN